MSMTLSAAQHLTDGQEQVLSLLPIPPGLLSVACSGTIIYLTARSGLSSVYNRILFGLSAADIFTSTSFILQHFLVPAQTSHRIWAIGNNFTCSLVGTTTQVGMSSLFYNGFLALYFLLTIRFGVKEKAFAKRYEIPLHVVAAGFPLISALVGAFLGVFAEIDVGIGCFFKDYPAGCLDDPDVECYSDTIAWVSAGIWVVLTMPAILIINCVIFVHVRRQMLRSSRRSMNAQSQTDRVQQVATQAILYVTAFTGTFIWTIVLRVAESMELYDEQSLFPLLVIQGALVPSTGLFNLIIYLRPTYRRTRLSYPLESRIWAVRRALYGESILAKNSTTNCKSSRSVGQRMVTRAESWETAEPLEPCGDP